MQRTRANQNQANAGEARLPRVHEYVRKYIEMSPPVLGKGSERFPAASGMNIGSHEPTERRGVNPETCPRRSEDALPEFHARARTRRREAWHNHEGIGIMGVRLVPGGQLREGYAGDARRGGRAAMRRQTALVFRGARVRPAPYTWYRPYAAVTNVHACVIAGRNVRLRVAESVCGAREAPKWCFVVASETSGIPMLSTRRHVVCH